MTTLDSGFHPAWVRRFGWHHPEWTWGLLALAGWVTVWVTGHAGLDHPYAHWLVMVAAMMLPPALPMIRYVELAGRWRRRHANGATFVAGFLLVWAGVGSVILTVLSLIRAELMRAVVVRAELIPPDLTQADLAGTVLIGWSRWGVLAAMVVAAGWELSPAKRRFLRRCHRLDTLPPDGWRSGAACLRFGIRYGWRSVGAGWALMLPMAVAGHDGFALMPLVAVIVAAEELLADGTRLTRAAAAALLGVAALMVGGS